MRKLVFIITLVFLALFLCQSSSLAAFATKYVTNCADSGAGSLRQILTDASDKDTIAFAISVEVAGISTGEYVPGLATDGSGNNWFRIIVSSGQLPTISKEIYILGSTQTYEANNALGPKVEIRSASGVNCNGLYLQNASNVTIEGLALNGFSYYPKYAIYLSNSDYCAVKGCYIGPTATGADNSLSTWGGIVLYSGSDYNMIGGAASGEGNLISDNTNYGIRIEYSSSNEVKGNKIGTNADGTSALPNGSNGIDISQSTSTYNMIGGLTSEEGNLISGNNGCGIYIWNNSSSNEVKGNYIGTNADGTSALPNSNGILIVNSCYNIIGGTTTEGSNLISGNNNYGINMQNYSCSNEVKGNYIGTNKDGTGPISNGSGIYLYNYCSNNIFGGNAEGEGNLISGNYYGWGLDINWYSEKNQVLGNYIGTNASGTGALANSGGMYFYHNTNYSVINGNLVSGNTNNGIYMNYLTGNEISGNRIGSNAQGTSGIPNGGNGIFFTDNNGPNTLDGNEIKYNSQNGILVSIYNTSATLDATNNVISNNGTGVAINALPDVGVCIFRDCTFEGNTTAAVANNASFLADFQQNDWGYATGPYHPTSFEANGRFYYNPTGQGGLVSGLVDYWDFWGWGTLTPSTPESFTGITYSATSILWEWDNSTWEALYYLAEPAGYTYTVLATLPADTTSYLETGLLASTPYTRRVIAWKIDGSERTSDETVSTASTAVPSVFMISPTGGEKWRTEDSHNIDFNASDPQGIKDVDIFYATDGVNFDGTIGTGLSNEAYLWTPPSTLESSSMRVKVTAFDNYFNPGTAESSYFLMDANPPTVSFSGIYYGQTIFGADSPYTLSWEASDTVGLGSTPIYLYYSGNDGSSWSLISNEANTGHYAWVLPTDYTDTARISVEAVDQVGHTSYALSPQFKLHGDTEKSSPEVVVRVNEMALKSEDYISKRPTFEVSITDPSGVDESSVRFYMDGIQRVYTVSSSTPTSLVIEYMATSDLADEKERTHAVRVVASDLVHNTTDKLLSELKVSYDDAKLVKDSLAIYPQVARFGSSGSGITGKAVGPVKIAYALTSDSNTTIYIIGDTVLKTFKIAAGQVGAKAGYNEVEWDGVTDFGSTIGNGIYPVKIVVSGKVIGTNYLVVAD